MSRAVTGNEKCVFCGWNRRNAYPSVRFFCIPKEPGLKRVRWLQVFGDREISGKDRVCSVHFRQARPSSDPSHEDFVPHLYLNNEPPAEVLDYLESLADTKLEKVSSLANKPFLSLDNPEKPSAKPLSRTQKPSILKRRRVPKEELSENEDVEVNVSTDGPATMPAPPRAQYRRQAALPQRSPGVYAISSDIASALNMKQGQMVIIRRRVGRKQVKQADDHPAELSYN